MKKLITLFLMLWAICLLALSALGADGGSVSWGVETVHADAYAASLRKREISVPVTVALIGGGMDSSLPSLEGRIVSGWDYVDNDGDTKDGNPNGNVIGTHAAKIVADCTTGLDNIQIMPVRVLDSVGYGESSNISQGIRYAANCGADVICLGMTGGHDSLIDSAVAYAIGKNAVVVAPAGDKNRPVENFCPGHIAECITVAAVDKNLKPSRFTNFGTGVDLAAPGSDISDGVLSMDGTFLAAVHVSACAAMLRSEFPSLTPSQVKERLANASQKPDGWDARYGGGALDMRSFLLGEPSELYAVLYDNGEMAFQDSLTVQPGRTALASYRTDSGGYDGSAYVAWYEEQEQIQLVSFETDIYPTSTALWFYGCENLTGFKNMERLHTNYVTDMSQMFAYCSSLQSMDLSGFSTANVTNSNTMFFRCSALSSIRVSDSFTVGQIADSRNMFDGCTSLIGGAGTKYDSAHTDKAYARIDGGASAPGYFTAA